MSCSGMSSKDDWIPSTLVSKLKSESKSLEPGVDEDVAVTSPVARSGRLARSAEKRASRSPEGKLLM